MVGHGNHRLKFSIFHHQSSSTSKPDRPIQYPPEYLCGISRSLMADPVVVSSGQTYERLSVRVCQDFGFSPTDDDGSTADFSSVITNRNMKLTILKWCDNNGIEHPQPPDYTSIELIVRQLMEKQRQNNRFLASDTELLRVVADKRPGVAVHAATEVGLRVNRFQLNSPPQTEEIVRESTILPFKTQPSCYAPPPQTEEIGHESFDREGNSKEEAQIISKFRSDNEFEQQEGVISLRNLTKSDESIRASLCTKELLAALLPLVSSRSMNIQINAVASVVNLSIEKSNKMKIVRSGFVPPLIDVLDRGSAESQEHAAGSLFSLSLDDENKMAIGILGGLPVLMNALRSENERTRNDSALCLYHLTLNPSNRVKLVKIGAVGILLSLTRIEGFASRILLILCNIAACVDGRSAMLDANAVDCLVGMLKEKEMDSESTRENCVVALHALSQGGFRFRGLATAAGAVEALREVEERGSERAREKAKRILQMMRTGGNGSVQMDGVDSGGVSWTGRVGVGLNRYSTNTTKF
ncbi:U-box domain-containing protein 38-like [Cucurbita pepo subsp. pepo]|uniref:U-box domain-containing protein 38-like n=1 Tax=Cucurbita pepo subsp. pepo TaxID=3664 RepID=UPI000C9D42C2|nr:U-box domain-containing protein 38-like [Cucurbita pepo subsp. pepo]